jgi:hypothetical protein
MRNKIIEIIEEALSNRTEFFTREQEIQIYLSDYLNQKKIFDNIFLEYHISSSCLLNYPWKDANNVYIDIVVLSKGIYYPIEIKFKTVSQQVPLNFFGTSTFTTLGHHGAQNIGCYDFWKDIRRLELIEENFNSVNKGIMLFVTNDESYLLPPRNHDVGYAQFSIEDYRIVKSGQTLNWNGALSISINRPPIKLNREYVLNWKKLTLHQHSYLLL